MHAVPALPAAHVQPGLMHHAPPSPPPPPARKAVPPSIAERELAGYDLHPDFADKYALSGELGHGATGFVMAAERIDDGTPVAVKFLYKNRIPFTNWKRDRAIGMIPLEAFLLRRVDHPNIIRFLDIFEDAKYIYMVMEMHGAQWKDSHISPDYEPSSLITHTTHHPIYPRSPQQPQQPQQQPDYPRPSTPIAASRVASPSIAIPVPQASSHTLGVATLTAPAVDRRHTRHASLDLFEYIENNPFFAERKVKHIFHQVALAVQYLHQNNIVHNDIKDENVVIDAELHAKLIDFGAAQFVPNHPSDYFEDFRGTNHYMPPEAVRGERYRGPEVDVWCMGVLLYTMAFSCPPFRTRDDIATASYRHPRFKRSAALMDLINAMLKVDPAQRLTMDQVVAHPWLANNASNMPLSPMPVSPLPHD